LAQSEAWLPAGKPYLSTLGYYMRPSGGLESLPEFYEAISEALMLKHPPLPGRG